MKGVIFTMEYGHQYGETIALEHDFIDDSQSIHDNRLIDENQIIDDYIRGKIITIKRCSREHLLINFKYYLKISAFTSNYQADITL